jgi:hypothetical protein
MATKKEDEKVPNLAPGLAQDAVQELIVTGETGKGVTFEQGMTIMENIDERMLTPLSGAQYLTFDKTGTFNFMFTGMDKMTSEDQRTGEVKEVDAVKLLDKQGVEYINANTILVNSLKKVLQVPCYVRVEYTGDVKAKSGGKYKDLKVFVLPQTMKP